MSPPAAKQPSKSLPTTSARVSDPTAETAARIASRKGESNWLTGGRFIRRWAPPSRRSRVIQSELIDRVSRRGRCRFRQIWERRRAPTLGSRPDPELLLSALLLLPAQRRPRRPGRPRRGGDLRGAGAADRRARRRAAVARPRGQGGRGADRQRAGGGRALHGAGPGGRRRGAAEHASGDAGAALRARRQRGGRDRR